MVARVAHYLSPTQVHPHPQLPLSYILTLTIPPLLQNNTPPSQQRTSRSRAYFAPRPHLHHTSFQQPTQQQSHPPLPHDLYFTISSERDIPNLLPQSPIFQRPATFNHYLNNSAPVRSSTYPRTGTLSLRSLARELGRLPPSLSRRTERSKHPL